MTKLTDTTFLKWRKLSHWRIEEAAAIWSGLDPDANQNLLQGKFRIDLSSTPSEQEQVRTNYNANLRIVRRAIETGGLSLRSGRHLTPAAFARWIKREEFEAPDFLLELAGPDESARASSGDDVHPKTRNALYRMIYILAARGKDLTEADVAAKVRTIVGDADKHGLKMDDETARKYLLAAIEHVDQVAAK